jgi:hypothetical protein
MMLIFFMVVSRLELHRTLSRLGFDQSHIQKTSEAKFQKTITAMTPAMESARACLASRLRSIRSVFMVPLCASLATGACVDERRPASPPTDQAMAVTTVKTAMQVVNAKAMAKIAAIFFMIASPTFPS